MSTLDEVLQWNRRKWESKNRKMYSSGEENTWAWYSDELDPDVAEFLTGHSEPCENVLDLGTCSGSQAIGMAEKGYTVVGTDISESALAQAEQHRQRLGISAKKLSFEYDDIITTRFGDDRFDLIFDRGCYHSICCFSHRQYVIQIKRILRPGGILLLKTMSSKEERFVGYEKIDEVTIQMPYKFDEAKLRELFTGEFEVIDVRDSFFYSNVTRPPARAVLAVLRNLK